ncbi:hypothetical protein HZ99_17705 [Pseudomonas fluorescens]|uniref:Uncharacterized protein n=1 Tax=Pseudomonas azotoformans TaxID=47878 RepID=A0A127HUL2_PSEAZ|nr:hypothetical protein HZ99_17705 [Pseudomonas fluorescens]AMN78081.1 hypothetical protein AYR47_06945 [Pseudomonas azotoformans]KTC48820.1 hypothetical protein AO250_18740 [Pseudomonas syringae pv. actinidiae ICMP 19497]OKS76112.1 hypothetical protein PsaNZ64_08565 [Pseudomonas syringae pv. actinidiae]ONH38874.1 hypothetical protein BLL38_22365 [Pseudomonas gessardii]PHN28043.1 hypothetical protein AO240_13095 [Pseudomonas sp. ICMP 460]PHN53764.1 hypothetical protein AO268_05645 [Pseudomona
MFLVNPDLAESASFAQGETGAVRCEHARKDFPKSTSFCLFKQRLKEILTQPLASHLTAHVNRKVSDAVIARAIAVVTKARPSDDLIVLIKHHQNGITIMSLKSL